MGLMRVFGIDTILFFVTILMVAGFGCKGESENGLSGKPVKEISQTSTINMVGHWLNEGKREDFVRNLTRVYEFENQHVKVNLKFPEDIYYDNLDRASNEKYNVKVIDEGLTDWDILRINGEYNEVYELLGDADWARKHLVDFRGIEAFKEGTRPELLTDDAKDAWNGMIPGPYLEGQYWALWYNRKVAEKIGIDIKQFGMTFDDFAGYLEAVFKYNQNHPDDNIIPVYESFVWETTMLIAYNLYSSLLDNSEEFLSSRITESRLQAWHQTLQAMEAISKFNPIDPSWVETRWKDSHEMMLNGDCLFYVNGSWMYNIWEGIDDDRIYDIVPGELPAFRENVIYPHAYSITWGVLQDVPNRDEAVDFLLEMNTPDVAEMWTRYTKCPTGIKGNLSSAALGGDQFEEFSRYVQENYSGNKYRYYDSSMWVLNNQHADEPLYFREVLAGTMTANEAMVAIRASIGW
jgi:hypothetical protein